MACHRKEIEAITKKQMEVLELKNTVTKSSVDEPDSGMNRRFFFKSVNWKIG